MGGFIGGVARALPRHRARRLDFLCAIIGAGLGAERIEIWTDVDGILQPRSQNLPRRHAASKSSASTSGRTGLFRAKCCPGTVLPLIQKNIRIRAESLNPSCEGTRNHTHAPQGQNIFKASRCQENIRCIQVAPACCWPTVFCARSLKPLIGTRCRSTWFQLLKSASHSTVDSNHSIPPLRCRPVQVG